MGISQYGNCQHSQIDKWIFSVDESENNDIFTIGKMDGLKYLLQKTQNRYRNCLGNLMEVDQIVPKSTKIPLNFGLIPFC